MFFRHYLEWDVIKGEMIIDLLRARRLLLTADKNLELKRLEYAALREINIKNWEDLRQKEIKLRESFIKFNDFVKENKEKRERAVRKIATEKENQISRENEVGIFMLARSQSCLFTHWM